MTGLEITSDEFDRRFDEGEDVDEYVDFEAATMSAPDVTGPRQINVTLPGWLVEALDVEAERRGIARKALINTALVEWTDDLIAKRAS